nr:glutamine-dependent NAD(+) synthetase-like [Cherax quadricarinatus]
MSLDGVEIICNGSGSTQIMGNANDAYKRIQNATARTGGCYLFANQRGCDGSPSYFGGDCCIGLNGDLVGLAMDYSLAQVQVITAAVNLETIRCYRHLIRSRCEHAATSTSYPRVQVLSEVRTVVEDSDYMPTDPPELCGRLLHTLYLPTYDSSPHAAHCASQLAMAIGSKHLTVALDGGVAAVMESFTAASGSWTSSQEHSGIKQEQETLNHLHSRLRMTMLYLFAQLRLRTLGRAGELLVLTSNNTDNILAGSWAKYGDTSADVNLIGCFTEKEIEKALLFWAKSKLDLPILNDIILSKVSKSSDRMLTCEELAVMRKLQTMEYCGPYSMFGRLMYLWRDTYSPQEVGEKVKAFFRWYNHQRLKMALTTHYYVIGNGPPDIDRPIFYSRTWSWQFTTIDRMVAEHGENEKQSKA